MGAWGVKLNQNDIAEDVRTSYKEKLQNGISNEEATQQLLDEYEGVLDDIDDGPNFWFVLADQQWKLGRLLPSVKERALSWIESGEELKLWYEESQKLGDARKKVLQKLKDQLNSPQPPEKRISKKRYYVCPWEIGDAFAYPLNSSLAEESGLSGKYIILQVGAKHLWREETGEVFPVVRCWMSDTPEFSTDLSKRSRCIRRTNWPRKDGNFNYGYEIITNSSRSVPKSLIYLGNYEIYRSDDDGANFVGAAFGVVWRFFEQRMIEDYAKTFK